MKFNHISLIGGLVVVLLLLSNIFTTTVLAGRWMIPTTESDHLHHQEEKKLAGGGGDPTTTRLLFLQNSSREVQLQLPLIALRRVLDSLNDELIRTGEQGMFVLLPLTRRRGRTDDDQLNFKLEFRPPHRTMGGFRTMGLSEFGIRAAENRANTRRPIFRFRSDPDWKQQQALPESRGGGTRIVYN